MGALVLLGVCAVPWVSRNSDTIFKYKKTQNGDHGNPQFYLAIVGLKMKTAGPLPRGCPAAPGQVYSSPSPSSLSVPRETAVDCVTDLVRGL